MRIEIGAGAMYYCWMLMIDFQIESMITNIKLKIASGY